MMYNGYGPTNAVTGTSWAVMLGQWTLRFLVANQAQKNGKRRGEGPRSFFFGAPLTSDTPKAGD